MSILSSESVLFSGTGWLVGDPSVCPITLIPYYNHVIIFYDIMIFYDIIIFYHTIIFYHIIISKHVVLWDTKTGRWVIHLFAHD